jgi:hypothetical protein
MKQVMTVLMDAPDRLLKQFYVCAFPQFSPRSYGTKVPQLKEFTISPSFHLQFMRNGYGLIQQLIDLCLNYKTKQASLNKLRNKTATISLSPHARGSRTNETATVYPSMDTDSGYFMTEHK